MHQNVPSMAPPAGTVPRSTARPVIVSAILFMGLTGIAYPLITTGAAQLLFAHQARGSLIEQNGAIVGSALIGQHFTQPGYFHGRPSLTGGDGPYDAAASGASNQGVLSRKLGDDVIGRAQAYREENGLAPDAPVPVDAVTASGSGLDPHISLANARLQAPRVATARRLSAAEVLSLIERHTTGRQFGVLGDPRINVLELNLALDAASSKAGS